MSHDEKRLACLHELTHIKNGDLWLKFAVSIIVALHWFNPLARLLRREIDVVGEEYCDERAVIEMTEGERVLYGGLILKAASAPPVRRQRLCSMLSAAGRVVKRRLRKIGSPKKPRVCKAASFASILAICSFAAVFSFAGNDAARRRTIAVSGSAVVEGEESRRVIASYVEDYGYNPRPVSKDINLGLYIDGAETRFNVGTPLLADENMYEKVYVTLADIFDEQVVNGKITVRESDRIMMKISSAADGYGIVVFGESRP
jgi:hypothetical protein